MARQEADERQAFLEKLKETLDNQQSALTIHGMAGAGKARLLQALGEYSSQAVGQVSIVSLSTGETFYTSTQASEITGCTRRQLQYWREKDVLVPHFNNRGTGRNVYYSVDDLVVLVLMDYMLSVGLDFQLSSKVLEEIRKQDAALLKFGQFKRFMLCRSSGDQQLELLEFNLEQAITALCNGQPAIPIWLDVVQASLVKKLKEWLGATGKAKKKHPVSQNKDLDL
uniref:MerR family transcriptional regulator n=1 Tax=Trichocoleus desertorum TaxID=1481672 RepID=UPI0025B34826|nr:MerR family transcriptional regulator [Trichocoleus desertorum]